MNIKFKDNPELLFFPFTQLEYIELTGTQKIELKKLTVNAILADYLADTNWTTYSRRLDTWYNYLHP